MSRRIAERRHVTQLFRLFRTFRVRFRAIALGADVPRFLVPLWAYGIVRVLLNSYARMLAFLAFVLPRLEATVERHALAGESEQVRFYPTRLEEARRLLPAD